MLDDVLAGGILARSMPDLTATGKKPVRGARKVGKPKDLFPLRQA